MSSLDAFSGNSGSSFPADGASTFPLVSSKETDLNFPYCVYPMREKLEVASVNMGANEKMDTLTNMTASTALNP